MEATNGAVCIFVCTPRRTWHKLLEFETEQEWLEYQQEQDQTTEEELARAEALGEAECPWPWYADAPIEICEPEVFDLINRENDS